ncbi:MAG: alpha/beta hydrolase fold domain-containing protein [Inquilinaceae bacterium]
MQTNPTPLDPQMEAAMAQHEALIAPLPPATTLDQERRNGAATAAFWNDGAPSVGGVEIRTVPGPGGDIELRIVRPLDAVSPAPVTVFIHGGGWALGSAIQTERAMRSLAADGGMVVVGPDYRLAPEHPFPAGLDDCVATVDWIIVNAGALGVDAGRLTAAGPSAGANLALATALRLIAGGRADIRALALFYGVFGADLNTPSYRTFGDGRFGLSRDRMAAFFDMYLPHADGRTEPLAVPLLADLSGLPPTYLCAAGLDVLRDDTLAMAGRLADANVPHVLETYDGLVHGFIGRGRMVDRANLCLATAARFLAEHA